MRWLVIAAAVLGLHTTASAGTDEPQRAASPAVRTGSTGVDNTGRAPGANGDGGPGGEPAGPAGTTISPSISAVLSAAYAAAGLDRDPGPGWIWRARLGGLVPWVTVRTTRDTSWQDVHSEVGHATSLEVRATWRLDRLIFDGRELQVASIEAARRRERKRIAARVIRAYFAWQRAEVLATGDPGERRERATRGAEAIAELDVATDGWFSSELRRTTRPTAPSPP